MTQSKFVFCIDNSDYPVSLEVQKIYAAVADTDAPQVGPIRVIDESGEGCLFPQTCFIDANPCKDILAAVVKAA